jgi:hypothetical protein
MNHDAFKSGKVLSLFENATAADATVNDLEDDSPKCFTSGAWHSRRLSDGAVLVKSAPVPLSSSEHVRLGNARIAVYPSVFLEAADYQFDATDRGIRAWRDRSVSRKDCDCEIANRWTCRAVRFHDPACDIAEHRAREPGGGEISGTRPRRPDGCCIPSRFPILNHQPCNAAEFARVASYKGHVVCDGDSGDEQIIRPDRLSLRLQIRANRAVNFGGSVIEEQRRELAEECFLDR